MKNTTRMRAATTFAAAASLTLTLAACSSGAGGAEIEGASAGATIDEEHSVGAMEDFGVGTSFMATETVDFSLMYRDHPNYPVKDDWSVFQHLEDDRNVTFTRTDVPLADWDAKKSLLIGAGDASDLIPVTYPGQETQFVSGGAILPVSDYLDYLPNYQDKIEQWGLEKELDNLRQADGKYYLLPGLREVPDVQYSVVVRDDLFQKAGITEDPETWEEFAQDLEKVKAANPGLSYAFSDRWSDKTPLGAMLQYMAPNYGTSGGWGYANTWYDADAEEFEFTGTTDEYKELVTQAQDLVASGALDPEITQSDDQAVQKFISGASAAISGNTQVINEYRTKFADAGQGDVPLRMIVLPGGPAGDWLPSGRLSSGIMISAQAAESPHFKAMLQFVDWLYYSDEGLEFAQWGVDGETFTAGADGVRAFQSDIGWNALNPGAPKKLNADFGYSNGVFLLANGSSKELLQSVMSDETKQWTEAVLGKKEILTPAPSASLNEMELEQASLLDTQLKDAVMAATAAFVTGQRPLDDWDAYVQEIEGLGSSQLIDTYNSAFERKNS